MAPSVRTLHCNPIHCLKFYVLIATCLIGILLITRVGLADDKPPVSADKKKNAKIIIKADRLISNIEDGWALFTGNVRVTQGTQVLEADSLKIYYKKDLNNQKKPAPGKESIEKIVAKGSVNIKSDNFVAITHKAIYNRKTKVIVLSGPDSKVISGNNSISGSQITLYMAKERIKVTSNGPKRVEAVFGSVEKE